MTNILQRQQATHKEEPVLVKYGGKTELKRELRMLEETGELPAGFASTYRFPTGTRPGGYIILKSELILAIYWSMQVVTNSKRTRFRLQIATREETNEAVAKHNAKLKARNKL